MPGRRRPAASGDAAVSIGGDANGPVSTTYIGTQVLDRSAVPVQAAARDRQPFSRLPDSGVSPGGRGWRRRSTGS